MVEKKSCKSCTSSVGLNMEIWESGWLSLYDLQWEVIGQCLWLSTKLTINKISMSWSFYSTPPLKLCLILCIPNMEIETHKTKHVASATCHSAWRYVSYVQIHAEVMSLFSDPVTVYSHSTVWRTVGIFSYCHNTFSKGCNKPLLYVLVQKSFYAIRISAEERRFAAPGSRFWWRKDQVNCAQKE